MNFIRRVIGAYKDGRLFSVAIRRPRRIYYQLKPRRKTKASAAERLRYSNELSANRSVIQRLVIDSNNCITDMCLIGAKYASDRCPLNIGNYRHAYTPIYGLLFAQMQNRPIDIAEIGIYNGEGLKIFRDFFPEARLFGFEFERKYIESVTALSMENTRIAFIDVVKEDCITRVLRTLGPGLTSSSTIQPTQQFTKSTSFGDVCPS